MNTNLTPATTVRARIIGNTIKNAGQLGIWVQGGWNQLGGGSATFGSVTDTIISNNTIDTVTQFHGIKISDAARIVVASNTINNVQRNAINIQSEATGTQSDISITGNLINGCNLVAGANPCVLFSTTSSNSHFIGNRIVGVGQNYDAQITAGSNSITVASNTMDTGGTGRLLDAGTGTQFVDVGGPISTLQNAVGPYTTYTNTANSRSASFGVIDNFNAIMNAGPGANARMQLNGVTYFDVGTATITLGAATSVLKLGSSGMFTANGATAACLGGSIGPSGIHSTVQKWLTITDNGNVVGYVPVC
jgi:hypothetical protein